MRKFKRGEILALSGEKGLVLCQCCQNMNLDSTNVKIKWLRPVPNGPDNVFKGCFMGTLKDMSQIIDGVKMINKGGLFYLDESEFKRLKDLQPEKSQVSEKKVENGDVPMEGQKRNNGTTRNVTKKVLVPKPAKKLNTKSRLKVENGDVSTEGQKRNNGTARNDTKKVLIPKPSKKFNMKSRLKNLSIINSVYCDIISEVIKLIEDKGEVNNNKDCYLPNCQVDLIDEFMFFSFNSLADLEEFEESSMCKSSTVKSPFVPPVPKPKPPEHLSKSAVQPIFSKPRLPISTSLSLVPTVLPSTPLANLSPPVPSVSPGVISPIPSPRPAVSTLIYEVTCKESLGEFHQDKYISGSNGFCILFNGTWLTPSEFERQAGSQAKKYKSSLRVNGKPIGSLIDPSGTRPATPSVQPLPAVSPPVPHVPGVVSNIPPPILTLSDAPPPPVMDVIPAKLAPFLTLSLTPLPPAPLSLDVLSTPLPPVPDVSSAHQPPVPDVSHTPMTPALTVFPTPQPPALTVFPTPLPPAPTLFPTPPPRVLTVFPTPPPALPAFPTPLPPAPTSFPTPLPPAPLPLALTVFPTPLPSALTVFPILPPPAPTEFPTPLPPVPTPFPTPPPPALPAFPTPLPPAPTAFSTSLPLALTVFPTPPPSVRDVSLKPLAPTLTVIPTPPPISLCSLPMPGFPPTDQSKSVISVSSVPLVPSTTSVLSVDSTPLSPVLSLSSTRSPPAHSSSPAGPTGIDKNISKMSLEVINFNTLTSSHKRSYEVDESEHDSTEDDEEVQSFNSVNFLENFKKSYNRLRDKNMLSDVTISCEKSEVEAHKLILASSSAFFSRLLQRNSFRNNPHPIIILKDIKMKHLKFILDFMYKGEFKVPQNDLAAVLQAGQALEVKGLKYHNPSDSEAKKRKVDQFPTSSGSSFTTKRSHSIC